MKCTCNGCIFRTQVKGQQRTQNFGRSRPSGSKIGARTAAVDPCFLSAIRNTISTTSWQPIATKFLHGAATMNGHSWVVPRPSLNKSKTADGGHIKFHKNANISVLDEHMHMVSYKDATWDHLQTTTAGQLSAYNVVESVATTTTPSCKCMLQLSFPPHMPLWWLR